MSGDEAEDQDVASPAQAVGVIEIDEVQSEPKSDEMLKYEKTLGGKKVYYRCGMVVREMKYLTYKCTLPECSNYGKSYYTCFT